MPEPVPTVDVGTANGRGGAIVLLDVREDDEWAAGHAPGAVHVPLGTLQQDSVAADATVYCICRSGGRSGKAAEALRGAGIQAHNVVGGMQAWALAGHPIEAGDGTAGSVI